MPLRWHILPCTLLSRGKPENLLKVQRFTIFVESVQQLVCSKALGQMIEAADKMECQRADGHSETERGRQRSLEKVKGTKKGVPERTTRLVSNENTERRLYSLEESCVKEWANRRWKGLNWMWRVCVCRNPAADKRETRWKHSVTYDRYHHRHHRDYPSVTQLVY